MKHYSPPSATDLEMVVLGALMIDKKAIYDISDVLFPEAFYKDAHKYIAEAILSLSNNGIEVDLLTVSNELKKRVRLDLIGGDFYLIELTKRVASSANIQTHYRVILQCYIQREVIKISERTKENAYSPDYDVFDLIDESYNGLNDLVAKVLPGSVSTNEQLIDEIIDKAKKIHYGELEAGLPIPIKNLHENTGGWQDTDLIILAARPGMGKTAFMLKCAHHLSNQNIPIGIFSLEMSSKQLFMRIICAECGIDSEKMRAKGLSLQEIDRINAFVEKLKKLPIYIDDTPALSIEQFQLRAKRMKAQYGVRMIFADYLQLFKAEAGNREQEISKVSSGMKAVAKQLDIPVMALSQLSRKCEERSGLNKRPSLSDLRDSGAIEQDADLAMFLFRPEYYKKDKIEYWDDDYGVGRPIFGECEWSILKHRNGASGIANLMGFHAPTTNFYNLKHEPVEEKEEVFF